MSFTYVIGTDIGSVRFEIGDTTSGQGVRANGSNLQDEEIQILLDREGTPLRAAAAACEMLARDWARMANITLGSRSESLGEVAEVWRKQAEDLRRQYGTGNSEAQSVFSVGAKRNDGYAQMEGFAEYASSWPEWMVES